MSGSSGIGQLLKGVVVGIVLILAIVGTMSMLDKNNEGNPNISTPTTTAQNPSIVAPEINIASQTPETVADANSDSNNQEQEKSEENQTDSYTPKLEGEKTAEEIAAEQKAAEEAAKPKFGILKLRTINPENNEILTADYVVMDNKSIIVAESNNSGSASYRLPIGTYKVTATLSKATKSTRSTGPVQSTRTVIITANKITDKAFELEPPTTIGVLQVSATNANNKQSIKANFIVQKENGETVASRSNVTHTLFKLKAGSYKVTVKSGNNSDFRTIVVEPGESTSEVFKLQESFLQGKVLVRIFETNSNTPVAANIMISSASGKKVQELRAVSQTELALPAGNYIVEVTAPNGKSSKKLTITAGQAVNQIFRFDAPIPETPTVDVKITDNVKITGVDPVKDTPPPELVNPNTNQTDTPITQNTGLGLVKLFARNDETQKPIKSNFYVQTLNGRNIDKKIYASSADFKLKPGKYKITVRSKGHKNIVRTIQVTPNQTINQAFSLQSKLAPAATAAHTPKPNLPVRTTAPPKPAKIPKAPIVIPNGFLNVSMQPPKNTHFIIADRKGKKIVELTSVPSGNFKLDTGVYIVTAINNGQRRKQTIQVHQGKTTRLYFKLSDFQATAPPRNIPPPRAPANKPPANKRIVNNGIPKGVLKSRIVDSAGRPLRGDLTVTNSRGQVVARSNSVTVGVFDLPAAPHTIMVNFRGLRGSEKVKITAGQTTMQTFTITPNNGRPAPANRPPANKPRDPKDVLRDKLKEELRRIF